MELPHPQMIMDDFPKNEAEFLKPLYKLFMLERTHITQRGVAKLGDEEEWLTDVEVKCHSTEDGAEPTIRVRVDGQQGSATTHISMGQAKRLLHELSHEIYYEAGRGQKQT